MHRPGVRISHEDEVQGVSQPCDNVCFLMMVMIETRMFHDHLYFLFNEMMMRITCHNSVTPFAVTTL